MDYRSGFLQYYCLCLKSPVGPEAVARWCSVKNVFLKISQNSQENIGARVSFLIKLQGAYNFIKKRLLHRYFPVNFAKGLRTPYFIEQLWWLPLWVVYLKALKKTTEHSAFFKSYFGAKRLPNHSFMQNGFFGSCVQCFDNPLYVTCWFKFKFYWDIRFSKINKNCMKVFSFHELIQPCAFP